MVFLILAVVSMVLGRRSPPVYRAVRQSPVDRDPPVFREPIPRGRRAPIRVGASDLRFRPPAVSAMFRVLCVDDNWDIADSEAQLLQVCGFDARACYDGAEALALAAAFRPTVCLIDLNMPGMNGDELAVRVRKREGGPPPVLVAVTARDDEQSQSRIRVAGLAPAPGQAGRPVGPAGRARHRGRGTRPGRVTGA